MSQAPACDAERIFKTRSGTAYERFGFEQGASGEVLLFVHGVGLNRHVWRPQVEAFSPDHPVVIYDTLGHGDSPLPKAGAQLADYVAQLDELISALSIAKVTMVGHSMGAMIAMAYALAHPARVGRLVAMMAVYDRSSDHRSRALATARTLSEDGPGSVLERTLERWFSSADVADPQRAQAIGQIRSWLEQVSPCGYARAYRVFAENGETFVGALGKLTMPCLFLTAGGDPNSTPEMSKKMAEAVPAGTCAVIPGERHMACYIAPDKVNEKLRAFLAQPLASASGGEAQEKRKREGVR